MSSSRRDGPLGRAWAVQKRQAREVIAGAVQMRGLMPLLMKSRNGGRWTPAERAELVAHLRVLSRLSPYLLLLMLPGSALLLPLYAWWLDQRRSRRSRVASDV